MIIAQLSDPHISTPGDNPFSIPVRDNFKKALNGIKKEGCDLLILSGDLCFRDPQKEIYAWIKKQIQKMNFEMLALVGNHDDANMIQKVLLPTQATQNRELYYTHEAESDQLIFLDTGLAEISSAQLGWLKEKIISTKKRPTIFMHHPPCLAGIPHMDKKWPFHGRKEFQKCLAEANKHITIFCGHYHLEKSISLGNLTIHIAPSTFFQINQLKQNFEIESYQIGWRRIELLPDMIRTSVRYLQL